MRVYKFRAWDTEEKRMIYLANNMGSQTHLQLNNHSWGVFEPDSEDYYGIASANSNLGDILMQFTGLKDKNGTEIYEEDIVLFTDNIKINNCTSHVSKVEWLEEMSGFHFHAECIGYYSVNKSQIEKYNVEVVGNIYENPELLEGRE